MEVMVVTRPPLLTSACASFSTPSQFIPNFCIPSRNTSKPRSWRLSASRFRGLSSPSLCRPSPSSIRLRILAHLGRTNRRRNFLRKKLIEDQKVRLDFGHFDPKSDPQSPNFDQRNDTINDDDSHHGLVTNSRDQIDSEVVELGQRKPGDSVLWSKLENWVDQYKKDVDLWGVGSAPVFTVFQDSKGNVKRVSVNEDEIVRRSRVDVQDHEDSDELNLRISCAKNLAREMESGSNVIPSYSSVAKFVVTDAEYGFISTVRDLAFNSYLRPKLLGVGGIVLCGFAVVLVIKWLFTERKKEVQYTQLEKEMMRRKMKSRKERDMLQKGHLEIVKQGTDPSVISTERPKLDKQELMESIQQAKASNDVLAESKKNCSNPLSDSGVGDFDERIQEIRQMAKLARESEGSEVSSIAGGEEEKQGKKSLSNIMKSIEMDDGVRSPTNLQDANAGGNMPVNQTQLTSIDEPEINCNGSHSKLVYERNGDIPACIGPTTGGHTDTETYSQDTKDNKCIVDPTHAQEIDPSLDAPEIAIHQGNAVRRKPRVIRSVKEARQYLSKKHGRQEGNEVALSKDLEKSENILRQSCGTAHCSGTGERTKMIEQSAYIGNSSFGEVPGPMVDIEIDEDVLLEEPDSLGEVGDLVSSEEGFDKHVAQDSLNGQKHESNGLTTDAQSSVKPQKWMEENFKEVEPLLEKIGEGFRDNYRMAREKVNAGNNTTQLLFEDDDGELEWMEDENLREIVFQVRENELTGRDPFYSMDTEDKRIFFEGLEKKAEKMNEKLLNVHEYLHSNIENLDYGADGISIYDPLEKMIPRWKVSPAVGRQREFLDGRMDNQKSTIKGEAKVSLPVEKAEKSKPKQSAYFPSQSRTTSSVGNGARSSSAEDPEKAKTLIEGSDGSVRAGKKSGKEYWHHTKKWSCGFLDSYNAETDPEIKSIMKDMGKDLDRWITEKEIQEAAELMDKLPERNKEFIENKLKKLKKEMEMFGPQAVVSKYREYADDKEEDYLWWLDLPHILCIELYTLENGEQRVGFYSLEMAADLELEPKPCHVIAFEDAGDCKNLCCIIQAHMEMLGNGHAFIVPRPPKDAFREAKANGFGVTVIRKGELELNVDQPLEEVEEQISEIGSKMYHDMIMRERSVDIGGLMKGVFGVNRKPTKRRRLKRARKKINRKPK